MVQEAENKNSPTKKRKRTIKKKDPIPSTATVTVPAAVEPPLRTLVIDNGGDTIKYGWSTDDSPRCLPNVTARLQQQWTVLVGDQLGQITNPTQLIGVTRTTERGVIVNMGNQIQVWKRLLDLMGIAFPLNTPTAQAFGWKLQTGPRNNNNSTSEESAGGNKLPSSSCAVLIALPPFCPRTVLDQIVTIWMEDFQFGHVGFCVSPLCAARLHPTFQTCCVVDLGWSHTNIVPVFQHRAVDKSAIRRMPIGARHLINIWKYHASYRQWNLMDQEWILRQALEEAGFISLQFKQDMRLAQRIPGGRRPFDREFVLPDFQDTFEGQIRLPPILQREAELKTMGKLVEEDDDDADDSEDEDFREEDVEDDKDEDFDENLEQDCGNVSPEEEDDEEEETLEQVKARLLVQRQEEERRRRELESQQQVLNISVERFAIPETLFRPSDVGLPAEWANLPESIYQSIEACPEIYRPALYRSIRLVGGLSRLKNLKERLEQELRCLVGYSSVVGIFSRNGVSVELNGKWLPRKVLGFDYSPVPVAKSSNRVRHHNRYVTALTCTFSRILMGSNSNDERCGWSHCSGLRESFIFCLGPLSTIVSCPVFVDPSIHSIEIRDFTQNTKDDKTYGKTSLFSLCNYGCTKIINSQRSFSFNESPQKELDRRLLMAANMLAVINGKEPSKFDQDATKYVLGDPTSRITCEIARLISSDYFEQEHWVTSQETIFIFELPSKLLEPISFTEESCMVNEPLLSSYREAGALNLTLKVLSCAPRLFEISNFLSAIEVD